MLTLYNTATRQKEPFVPQQAARVTMYVCGPTVYDVAHIGNARPVVVFDTLFRLLKTLYPVVEYARNITDVDDKIVHAAAEKSETIAALTTRTTAAFHEDMAALCTLSPTFEPRATAHIAGMIAMVETLIAKEFAYIAEGHVLFDIAKMPNYGSLSRRTADEMLAGARVEVAAYKKNAGDFVLWKPSLAGQPAWQSPWGMGRPGWHLECSAMSKEVLKTSVLDIHGGGHDLIFPHHENEIAQSCCANDTDIYAKYWLHNGFVTVDGKKMSKSLGNFTTVRELLEQGVKGETIRYVLQMAHYRQPVDWSHKNAEQAAHNLGKIYEALRGVAPDEGVVAEPDADFLRALYDDMNTPLALMRLQQMANALQKSKDPLLAASLRVSAALLGLLQTPTEQKDSTMDALTDSDIESLLKERTAARAAKDFVTADAIRKQLDAARIIVIDAAEGATWRRG